MYYIKHLLSNGGGVHLICSRKLFYVYALRKLKVTGQRTVTHSEEIGGHLLVTEHLR